MPPRKITATLKASIVRNRVTLIQCAIVVGLVTIANVPAHAATSGTTSIPLEQTLQTIQDFMQGTYARVGAGLTLVLTWLGVAHSDGNSATVKLLAKGGLGVAGALNVPAWTNVLGAAAGLTWL